MSIWYYSLHLQKHVRGNILEQRGEHLASLALLATLMTGSIDLQLLPPAMASKLHDVSHSNTSSEVSILASFRAVAGQNLCLLTAANSVKQFLAETAWKRFPRKNHPTHFFLIFPRPNGIYNCVPPGQMKCLCPVSCLCLCPGKSNQKNRSERFLYQLFRHCISRDCSSS